MMSNSQPGSLPACPGCGTLAQGKFCSACGHELAAAAAFPRGVLRSDAADMLGLDRRIAITIRDLLLHPVRIIGSWIAGDRRRYVSPLKFFFLAGGLYVVLQSFIAPPVDMEGTTILGTPLKNLGAIDRMIAERGIPVALFEDRVASRWKALTPLVAALAIFPMVLVLELMDRRRPWDEHFMFMLGYSNTVWLVSLVFLPLLMLDRDIHSLVALPVLYVYLGFGYFAFYAARSRVVTALKFAVVALADMVVTSIAMMVMLAGIIVSALYF